MRIKKNKSASGLEYLWDKSVYSYSQTWSRTSEAKEGDMPSDESRFLLAAANSRGTFFAHSETSYRDVGLGTAFPPSNNRTDKVSSDKFTTGSINYIRNEALPVTSTKKYSRDSSIERRKHR